MNNKDERDAERQRKREEEADRKWEEAQKDIERHDREFNEKHGKESR